MAKRLNPKHDEQARSAIQTSQLNRLQGFALSAPDAQAGTPIDMTPAQVKAVIALLKKTMPDLQSVELTLNQIPKQAVCRVVDLAREDNGLSLDIEFELTSKISMSKLLAARERAHGHPGCGSDG